MKAILKVFRDLVPVLPAGARRFLIIYSILLAMLTAIDALSLVLLAVVITPLVTGSPLHLPIFGTVEGAGLFVILGVVSALVILKGVLAVFLLWGSTRRFARYELEIGNRLFESYIDSPWVDRLKRNSSDLTRMTDSGVAQTIAGFLLPATSVIGDILTFITIVVVLAVAQPAVGAVTIVYLGLIGALLFFWITRRARQAGLVNLTYSLRVARFLTEMVGAQKEITLRNKIGEVTELVRANRVHSSRARANIQFLGQVPRFVLESAIIGGFVLVGIAGFLVGGLNYALTAIALFALAGFRLAPSVVRFQTVLSTLNASVPYVEQVIREIHQSEDARRERRARPDFPLPSEPKSMALNDVCFRYEAEQPDVLKDVTMSIPFGTVIAFVGESGAGKSTLVDMVLGLIEPSSGTIAIDGMPLSDVSRAWRSKVGYVPQEVSLFDGTVAQNVALTWSHDVDEVRVRSALERAQMLSVIDQRVGGVNGYIGERGLALSGGQRQRLGIARALYADPIVLVMDEATSSLDSRTESAITDAIAELRGTMTVILVAHRLSTIMHADQIYLLSHGKVAGQGTFAELVAKSPEFAHQAKLAGLADARGSTP